jgi:hypothetical protein
MNRKDHSNGTDGSSDSTFLQAITRDHEAPTMVDLQSQEMRAHAIAALGSAPPTPWRRIAMALVVSILCIAIVGWLVVWL